MYNRMTDPVTRRLDQIERGSLRVRPADLGTWGIALGRPSPADAVLIAPVDLRWLIEGLRPRETAEPRPRASTPEAIALSLRLRQAAREYLGIQEGEYWDSDVAEAQAAALLADSEVDYEVYLCHPEDQADWSSKEPAYRSTTLEDAEGYRDALKTTPRYATCEMPIVRVVRVVVT